MSGVSVIQRSMAGGEVSPAIYARTDLDKYQTGLKTCRNFVVQKHGGVANRSGTELITEIKDSTKVARLIRFKFNAEQTYALEFGEEYIRFIRNGVQLRVSGLTAYVGATIYDLADLVEYSGVNYYSLSSDNIGNQPDVSPDEWYPLTDDIYEIPSPYLAADLRGIQYTQSGDIITLVHPDYDPVELRRAGELQWSLVLMNFNPDIGRPTACAGTAGGAGANTYNYKVVAIAKDSLEMSLPGVQASKTITGITQANPAVVTSNAHGYANGDEVLIDSVVGMEELNGQTFVAAGVAANTFQLQGVDSTNYGAYVSGGLAYRTHIKVTSAAVPTAGAPINLTWAAPSANVLEYDIFKQVSGSYGYIGTSSSPSFADSNITPDMTDTPPIPRDPFLFPDDKPYTVTYAQQRLVFGATNNDPETVFMSRSANFHNFTYSSPTQANDAITFPIAGEEVNQIRHVLEISGRFVVMTSGGEWTCDGDDAGIILPNAVNPRQHGGYGSSSLRPIKIGGTIIFLQARESIIRDLKFDIRGYQSRDLTVFASHLFDNHTIVAMDFQQVPNSIHWCARADGKLIGMTFLEEHEVWGWHRHDTNNGFIEDVLVVPEEGNYGSEDFVYLIVNRTINGQSVRFIERMYSRKVDPDALDDDAWFVDCGLVYDGRNADATKFMTLTGGAPWVVDTPLTLNATGHTPFSLGEVGNAIVLKANNDDGEEDSITLLITGYTDTDTVTVIPNKDVATWFQNVAINNWSRAVDSLAGADHLEGENVAIFADSDSVSDGVSTPLYTVTGGAIQLNDLYSVIKVGIPITAELDTLEIDIIDGETIIDKKTLIGQVALMYQDSRGTLIGASSTSRLSELRQRSVDDDWNPIRPFSGTEIIRIEHTWNRSGGVYIKQVEPLPVTILGVIPSIQIGGK